ncbi:Kelch like member 30 [Trebouxia sp. C0009 RCD-2024]
MPDATIAVGHRRWPVHRAELAMDSPSFKAAFQSEDNEGCGCTLHITDTDEHTMDLLLEWVYGGLGATPSLPETEALKRCILVCSLE